MRRIPRSEKILLAVCMGFLFAGMGFQAAAMAEDGGIMAGRAVLSLGGALFTSVALFSWRLMPPETAIRQETDPVVPKVHGFRWKV